MDPMGFPHLCWLPHISRPSGSPSKEPEQERRLQEVKAWKSPHGSCVKPSSKVSQFDPMFRGWFK